MRQIALCFFVIFTIISCKTKKQEIGASKVQTKQRPNIIFIMADDHAAQAIRAYSHPISKLTPTPNIDRIAKDGAILKNKKASKESIDRNS